MYQSFRAAAFILCLSSLVLSGCKKDTPPGDVSSAGNTPKVGAPVVNRWPNRAAMLAAAPPEKLVTKEVKVDEETYLLDVPEAAKITTPDTDTIINVEFAPEKQYSIRWAPENIPFFKKLEVQNDHGQLLFVDNDTLVALKSDGTIHASMNINDEYRNLGVRVSVPWHGKDWTEKDFMLALKSAATLRVKTPYEKDPLALAKRLGVNVSEGAPETVKYVTFPSEATTNTLKLLSSFPNVENLDFRLTAGFNELATLPDLSQLTKLRDLEFGGGSPPESAISQRWLGDIAKCTNLEKLQIDWFLKTTGEFEPLGKLTNLQELKLRANQEALGASQALTALKKLKKFSLWLDADDSSPLIGDLLNALAKLPELEELTVHGGIKGMLDADLAKLAAFPMLKSLEWKSNDFEGQASPNLQASSIESLDLEGHYQKGTLSKEFIAGLPAGLKGLRLLRFQLSEDAAAALANLPQLERLVLDNCRMNRAAVLKLGDSKSLKAIKRGYGEEPASKKLFDELKKNRPELDL